MLLWVRMNEVKVTLIKDVWKSLRSLGRDITFSAKEREYQVFLHYKELMDIVEDVTERVEGLGELYAYDTTLRIGAFLGVFPEKVYLHAGARVGAKTLGIDGKVKVIELQSLPEPFHSLQPHQVEDALCIYKKLLKRS